MRLRPCWVCGAVVLWWLATNPAAQALSLLLAKGPTTLKKLEVMFERSERRWAPWWERVRDKMPTLGEDAKSG